MNRIYTIITLSLFLILVACDNNSLPSQISSLKITNKNLQSIVEQMNSDESVSNENKELFINAISRFGDVQDSIVGKTVGEIIVEQEKYVSDRIAEALVNTGARVNLFINHRFQYLGIKFIDSIPTQKKNNLVFTLQNTSDKVIKHLEGILQFYTPAGELIKVFSISTNLEMPVSDSLVTLAMPFEHNDNIPRDMLIRTSTDLKAVWTPILIVFADNTKIEDIATKNAISGW
ncbi:MAG: hypothetical protein LBO69_04910 [Ignavibacteria bacterium]|jgi:hypothetical protein|nr:hypothetical protein [Ignavibacteria bacterium]